MELTNCRMLNSVMIIQVCLKAFLLSCYWANWSLFLAVSWGVDYQMLHICGEVYVNLRVFVLMLDVLITAGLRHIWYRLAV